MHQLRYDTLAQRRCYTFLRVLFICLVPDRLLWCGDNRILFLSSVRLREKFKYYYTNNKEKTAKLGTINVFDVVPYPIILTNT